MILNKLVLYLNTVKYLKLTQIYFNLFRRLKTVDVRATVEDVETVDLVMMQPIKYSGLLTNNSLCFLNVDRSFDEISDWYCKNEPKLWRYNLHYFDYLQEDSVDPSIKDKLIDGWIEASASLTEDAWEPYPVSLRIVNWIKYFTYRKNNVVPVAWLKSLHLQAEVLNKSVEYHILANHYLKNGKALFFAGAYFKSSTSKKWFEEGRKILLTQVKEQFLDDGGHYEKSPMYHSIMIEDYLDVINLIKSNKLVIDQVDMRLLESKVHSALAFLNKILMPDGNIPLFNDSAFGIAPAPAVLFEYASQVTDYKNTEVSDNGCCPLADSGYFCISNGSSKLVVDCGSVSPDYQPGHTHCDLLSYELAINGIRIVVDTGVYDYGNTEMRHYSRSTSAHNTIVIDGKEQSELWSQFRVARRARVLSTGLVKNAGTGWVFSGSYLPFWSGWSRIIHQRVVQYDGKIWSFKDEVLGKGTHDIKNYIHLHPELEIRRDTGCCHIKHGDVEIAKILFENNYEVGYEDGWYFPQFGIKQKNVVITLTNKSVLPLVQKYSIEAMH